MARNLIRPLGSTHIFTQSGSLILFNPDHLSGQSQIGESRQTLSLPQNLFVQDRRLTICSSIAAAASHHHEESSLIHGLLAPILLDKGFPVEYELDEFNMPHTEEQFLVASSIGYVDCDAKSTPTPCYFISGQHFLETFTLFPEATRTTNSWVTSTFLSSNSKHDFCYTMANISPSHIQQCLNLTMHFSLRHLAAKMLSQLYNNFISFSNFFPSFGTCSINVKPLFRAAIKAIIKTLWHLRTSLSHLFTFKTYRGSKQTHTHARYISTLEIMTTFAR